MLRRTASGLASLHLFHGVDIVVYCEGGAPLALEDVLAGGGDDTTNDAFFWQKVQTLSGSARTFHFKSVGSKPVLKSMAYDVNRDQIQTIRIALDADHDRHNGNLVPYSFVAYTFGYSWENDVLQMRVVERLFWQFQNSNRAAQKRWRAMKMAIKKFEKDVSRFSEYEISLALAKGIYLFPRARPLSVVTLGGSPRINIARLKAEMEKLGYKRGPYRRVRLNSEVLRYTFGHLVAAFIYQVFVKILSGCKPKFQVPFNLFMRLAISEFVDAARAGELGEVGDYFSAVALQKLG